MILVTGASGFVGRAVVTRLHHEQQAVLAALRSEAASHWDGATRTVVVDGLAATTDWSTALKEVSAVIHCAARVHVMREPASDPMARFRAVNVDGTLRLARQAVDAGVKRFVFVSSVKVNGEATQQGHPFRADDPPGAQDPYGLSKHEAEEGLRELARTTNLEVAIVRPPLVYGPGVKANFAALARAVARGIPLPLGAVTGNRRSLVALDNLVDLLLTCIEHPAAANQTFLVSDGEDLSTAELIRRIAGVCGRQARLLRVPPNMLLWVAGLLGRSDAANRLLGSLQVDISNTCERLQWRPPVSVDEGLRRAVEEWTQ